VIFVGIDDTDIINTPGTNQLARVLLTRLGKAGSGAIICRHQLFFDPRVPYTNKNGSASIQLPQGDSLDLNRLIEILRAGMREWFVEGSDPGLCVSSGISEEMTEFGRRCKSEVVTQAEARSIALRAGCHLESLGGTEQGIIGALAGIALVAGGDDGRVIHLESWPYPDEFSGPHRTDEIRARGVDEIRQLGLKSCVTDDGLVDIGKHLRPNWRGGKIVLYVEPSGEAEDAVPWRAVKLP
jgi:hypothetical protein